MKKNDLLKKEDTLIRVLEIQDNRYLIIDCIKKTMPVWVDTLEGYQASDEEELYRLTSTYRNIIP